MPPAAADAEAARLFAVALAALDLLADHGDNGARHAAAVLRGARSTGRPSVDDRDALEKMERLIAQGHGRAAAMTVARGMTDDALEATSIAKRLRKKYARKGFRAL